MVLILKPSRFGEFLQLFRWLSVENFLSLISTNIIAMSKTNEPSDNSLLHLLVLLRHFLRSWRIFVICQFFSVSIAFAYISLARAEYWAAVDVDLMYSDLSSSFLCNFPEVFDASIYVSQAVLHSPTASCTDFLNSEWGEGVLLDPILSELGWLDTEAGLLLQRTFQASYIPSRGVVVLVAHSYSPQEAVSAMGRAADTLQDFQDELSFRLHAILDRAIAQIDEEIMASQTMLEQFDQSMSVQEMHSRIVEFLAQKFVAEEVDRIQILQERRDALIETFAPYESARGAYNSRSAIRVVQTYPKTNRVLSFSVVTGLFLSFLVIAFTAAPYQLPTNRSE